MNPLLGTAVRHGTSCAAQKGMWWWVSRSPRKLRWCVRGNRGHWASPACTRADQVGGVLAGRQADAARRLLVIGHVETGVSLDGKPIGPDVMRPIFIVRSGMSQRTHIHTHTASHPHTDHTTPSPTPPDGARHDRPRATQAAIFSRDAPACRRRTISARCSRALCTAVPH